MARSRQRFSRLAETLGFCPAAQSEHHAIAVPQSVSTEFSFGDALARMAGCPSTVDGDGDAVWLSVGEATMERVDERNSTARQQVRINRWFRRPATSGFSLSFRT